MPDDSQIKKAADNWPTLLIALALGAGSGTGVSFLTSPEPADRFTGAQGKELEIRLNSLEQYHMQTWPTERALIAFEIQKVADRLELVDEKVGINDENIEEIQDMIR